MLSECRIGTGERTKERRRKRNEYVYEGSGIQTGHELLSGVRNKVYGELVLFRIVNGQFVPMINLLPVSRLLALLYRLPPLFLLLLPLILP